MKRGVAEISRYAKLVDMKKVATEVYKRSEMGTLSGDYPSIRIWKIDAELSADRYIDHLKKYAISSSLKGTYSIPPRGICFLIQLPSIAGIRRWQSLVLLTTIP